MLNPLYWMLLIELERAVVAEVWHGLFFLYRET